MPLNLVIHDLVKGSAFVEEGVELDNVRVLDCRSGRLVERMVTGEEANHRVVLIRSPVET